MEKFRFETDDREHFMLCMQGPDLHAVLWQCDQALRRLAKDGDDGADYARGILRDYVGEYFREGPCR